MAPDNMKIHPLISDTNNPHRARRTPLQDAVRRGRYRVHARKHLLARPVPDPDRQQRRSRGDRPEGRGLDLKPLLDLLVENDDVLKMFHAGGQDLEIVHNLTGKIPVPLFDTQIAAMALGLWRADRLFQPDRMRARPQARQGRALHRLVAPPARQAPDRLCHRRRHPPRHHLPARWSSKLRKTGRGGWLDEEMERLADPSSFAFPPEDAWKRLKLPGRNPQLLGRLKALAAWRETEARGKNLPRGRIVKDDTLGELAAHPPKTQDDLGKVRGLSAGGAPTTSGPADGRRLPMPTPIARRTAPARPQAPRPDQGRRAGQRPAQAAAQDPLARNRGRVQADRPLGRARSAGRRGARRTEHSDGLAVRPVRERCARPGRRTAGVRASTTANW